jgi:signal transduction histidine kinase
MLSLLSGLSSVSFWILATTYLPASTTIIALSVLVFVLAISVSLGALVANYAIRSTDFLSRAILLVSNENQVAPPNPELLKVGREFLIGLANHVYDLAKSSTISSYNNSGKNGDFFKTLADILPLPVLTINKEQQINFANVAALKYIGQSAENVLNKPVFDILNLSFVGDMTLEAWQKDCAQKAAVQDEIWERVRLNFDDGSRKQFDMAAHFSNNDPNGLETTLVLFDKTRAYERDDRDLTFIALAVHELRAPLTIMRGYVEVFEDELTPNLNNEQTTFMHNMGASAERLTSFVSNILNVARVEENALTLRLKEESWKDVLTRTCQDMELRAGVHNKKLKVNIADNLPTVAIDEVSVYEVIMNLIDNAIKYTHTDEEITISSYEKDGMIETTVADKGVGIPESILPHIFEKFFRAHNSKNSVGGTGLGLYLCRAIVNAHGGQIWVKSKESQGSVFGFTIPIYQNVADQIKNEDNKGIIRGAHGWIKNHSLYRE